MRNKLTIKILFFITVLSSVSSSIKTTWLSAMRICENSDKRPTKTMDIVKKDSWIGEAKYKLKWGEVLLRVEAAHRNKTCMSTAESNCRNSTGDCEFCYLSNLSFQAAWNKSRHLTPNKKYIIADLRSIAEITEPDLCLMKTSNFTTRFVFCEQKHYHGCQETDEFSNLKITFEARINSNANELKMNRVQQLLCVLFLLGKTSLL